MGANIANAIQKMKKIKKDVEVATKEKTNRAIVVYPLQQF
ncbi:hypothetical protein X874_17010 [Mannheimia varigena USDA-ARS-USMARC-1312]|uniref:Uncharacterized protein n=1 Tax=Mannheimia varigena USDA-ARS-USMARC-1296 TaxID=1433287 RepID=W0QBR9_9PAST|nr:hypothetical protein X808_18190 [Mannheimia varigena USDA-ARS-USMARC-1296]AHG78335.1 hypothetical protein X874_17010 [Mannheimia varigena USDA-ARS-USMARC-1312]AHG78922.1 hypothetical protein X875_3020 [Mannheimia varigena USDA-ARS-USMARC-1388]